MLYWGSRDVGPATSLPPRVTSSESSGEKQTETKKRGRPTKRPAGKTRDDEETDTDMPLDEHDPLGGRNEDEPDDDDDDDASAVNPAIPEDLRGGMPLKRPAAKTQKKPAASKRPKKNAVEDMFKKLILLSLKIIK